jgi:hypothetical protein
MQSNGLIIGGSYNDLRSQARKVLARLSEWAAAYATHAGTATPRFSDGGLFNFGDDPHRFYGIFSSQHVRPSSTRWVTNSVTLNDLQVEASFPPITIPLLLVAYHKVHFVAFIALASLAS